MIYSTPLLAPESPLDSRSRELIQKIYEEEQAKMLVLPTDDPLDPKRRMRVELTLKELMEQPEVIQRNLDLEAGHVAEIAAFLAERELERIYMVGCGDSVASMIAVRSFYESLLGIPCEPMQALDFTYYYYQPLNSKTLVITLSSSGATTRTVEAMLLARALGATTLTLSNTAGSPLMVESTQSLLIHAERKGWPTQSSTAAMALLYQLGLEMAKRKGSSRNKIAKLQAELNQTPQRIQKILDDHKDGIAEVAAAEAGRGIYLFAGGGPAYASALIGAAKVKECTPDHAIAIPLEEFHHYNSQKAGDPLFLIAAKGPSIPRALDTVREGRRWGGQVYSITTQRDTTLAVDSNRVFYLPEMVESLTPLVYTVPLQLLAYFLAMEKFRLAEAARVT
jgi:glucosamine--fructose-6-phosphate aminotransferase (isomerizing)